MEKEEKKAPKLRFNGYTNDWERKKLGDVAKITPGGTPSKNISNYWYPKEIPWLSSGEINKEIIFSTDGMISKKGFNNSSAKWIKQDSVLIALAGQGKTRGKVAINRIPLTTNQSIAGIEPSNEVYYKFLYHQLTKDYLKLRLISSGDGSRGGLNKKLLNDYAVNLSSIDEQHKLGILLSHIDNTLQLHEDYLQLLHSFKIFLAQKMFFDDDVLPLLRFNGFTEKWSQCKLNDHTIVTMGQSPNSKNYTNNQNDEILVQGNADLYKNKVLKRVFTTEITKTAVKNDILISVRAPVGDTARNQYKSVVIGRGIASIKGNDFLYYQLEKMKNSGFWHKYIAGSTFESITGKDLKNAKIYTTSNDEERKIGGVFSSLTRIIQLYEHKIDSLKKLKQFLLQNMFV
ncbi:restriction endonuclease subunit S [Ligilactobacillus salivarius]|uniref:restriction endonuclease subunit S n=1 Tax=Ligilactobacillus salivarius TaxID=1624 RepID=UPI001879E4DD|nr:restriction endonuclease subunit S [Ligilactobacillus salivarius]MBE7390892.1 restriction endonuclease subunit S [Ligilactobacillus salivarius]